MNRYEMKVAAVCIAALRLLKHDERMTVIAFLSQALCELDLGDRVWAATAADKEVKP